jgi:hypothetical protein
MFETTSSLFSIGLESEQYNKAITTCLYLQQYTLLVVQFLFSPTYSDTTTMTAQLEMSY